MLVRMPQDKQSADLKLHTWAALVVETGGSCAALCVCLRQTQEQRVSTSCAGLPAPLWKQQCDMSCLALGT